MARATILRSFLVVFLATPAGANLLPNPEFDTDLSGWTGSQAQLYSPDDSDGSPTSGSVQFEVEDIGSESMTACVPVSVGVGYDLSLDVKLDFSPNNQGKAGMVVRFKSAANCSGADLQPFPANISLSFAPDWTKQQGVTTSPEGAVAALVSLTVTKTNGGGGSVVANLDEVFFGVAGGGPGCGDPVVPYGTVTSSDALHVLRSSVGTASCEECHCDANNSGSTTASDALTVLRAAVDLPVDLVCPDCV